VRLSPRALLILGASAVLFLAAAEPSPAQESPKPQQPPPQSSPQSPQTKKPPVGPAAPQSTHYPILLLVQGNDQSWSLRIGLKGPERLDRNGYPPIPLEPADVVRVGTTDSWTYHAKDSQTGAAVSAHIARAPCSDPAGTTKFAFTASVEHAQIGSKEGCARVATELFPKINNQPTDDDDDAKNKPAPPTVTNFKPPVAVAYISASGKLVIKRGGLARTIPGKDNYQPALSHDGKRLLYTTEIKGDSTGGVKGSERTISLYDWTTAKSSELLRGSVRQPFWSPDDIHIAFLKYDDSKWQLWTMPADAPEKAALVYAGEVDSLHGWADAQTILADDLQTLSWIGDDGTVKQTLSGADLYGKDQFGPSSANTVRIHPLNPDLLLVSAEWLASPPGAPRDPGMGQAQALFIYEIRSKRRVLLSPPNMFSMQAEWSKDGLQIFFTGNDLTAKKTAIYKMFWDGTSQVKVQDGYNLVIGQ
jgi:hypothetical protein